MTYNRNEKEGNGNRAGQTQPGMFKTWRFDLAHEADVCCTPASLGSSFPYWCHNRDGSQREDSAVD